MPSGSLKAREGTAEHVLPPSLRYLSLEHGSWLDLHRLGPAPSSVDTLERGSEDSLAARVSSVDIHVMRALDQRTRYTREELLALSASVRAEQALPFLA